MNRSMRLGIAAAAILALSLAAAGPALAQTALSVAAPAEATVGETVPVTVTVTDAGAPVAGVEVTLSRRGTFAGIAGFMEIVRATTAADGTVDLSYVQRAAQETTDLRVEVTDGDGEPLDFSVTSVGPGEQIFRSEVGVELPGLGGWVLIALIGGLWSLIFASVFRLRKVAAEGDESDNDSAAAKPKRHLVTLVLPVIVGTIAVVLVTVLVRNPATHENISERLGAIQRVPISYLSDEGQMISPGLKAEFTVQTGDPTVDGPRLFFGYGCTSCHGLDGVSGVVGGDISGPVGDGLDEFLSEVRRGPKGMPAYPDTVFSDEDLAVVHAYLEGKFSG